MSTPKSGAERARAFRARKKAGESGAKIGRPRSAPDHGSPEGYRRHLAAGTPACGECLAALAQDVRVRRLKKNQS